MRAIQIHPFSLVVGALAVGAILVLGAQTTPPAQTTWPPPKSMIVNVFYEPPVGFPVPAGGTYTVLTVPSDRWLTITGCSAAGSTELRWAELAAGGALTDKGFVTRSLDAVSNFTGAPEASPAHGAGPIGWTFAPGSAVVLRNTAASPLGVNWYSLIGYYSRS